MYHNHFICPSVPLTKCFLMNVVSTAVFSQFSVTVSPTNILSRLNVKGKLLQFAIHSGSLAKTFYIIDRTPNLTLQVRNEFNCFEFINLTCVTKRKLSLDRSTATCLGTSTFYDDGTRRMKLLDSNEIRQLRDMCEVNGISVYVKSSTKMVAKSKVMCTFAT